VLDRTANTSPEGAKSTSPATIENEFLRAVSGRKRNLIVDVLNGDARIRRALTQQPDVADIPEQARTQTLERLSKAAHAELPYTQYNLAGKLLRGETVLRDMAAAQKWLTHAAEQGYAPAQSLLALIRSTGKGAKQNAEPDDAEAAFWWSLAAEAGNPGAKLATERLRSLLKPQEHVRAQRLRARWGSLITDLANLATGETSRRDLDRALQDAAEKGDLDAVLSLLSRGADTDQSGDAERNAVINAAWRGRQRIIQLLLERGVETELPDDEGRTPLI
jgi:TPR repeat protein